MCPNSRRPKGVAWASTQRRGQGASAGSWRTRGEHSVGGTVAVEHKIG